MLRSFDRVTFERVGLLQGEHALLRGAEALLRPDGTCIKIYPARTSGRIPPETLNYDHRNFLKFVNSLCNPGSTCRNSVVSA
jgi:hypothetical protein